MRRADPVADAWAALGALAAVLLPMLLAGWLLGRPEGDARVWRRSHGKMPSKEEG